MGVYTDSLPPFFFYIGTFAFSLTKMVEIGQKLWILSNTSIFLNVTLKDDPLPSFFLFLAESYPHSWLGSEDKLIHGNSNVAPESNIGSCFENVGTLKFGSIINSTAK